MRKLTAQQFAAHANQQIANAISVARVHVAGPGGYCSCGKQVPCPVAAACQRTIKHFEGKLALLEATRALPVAPAAQPDSPARSRRWRRLIMAVLL